MYLWDGECITSLMYRYIFVQIFQFSLFTVCLVVMNTCPGNSRMSALIKHINETHDQDLAYEQLTFANDELFKEWLGNVQRDVPCSFRKKHQRLGKKTTD